MQGWDHLRRCDLKDTYLERVGPAQSDRATVIENWRVHGDYLNEVTIIYDPVYLTEPVVHTSAWVRDKRIEFVRHPCAPQETAHTPFHP